MPRGLRAERCLRPGNARLDDRRPHQGEAHFAAEDWNALFALIEKLGRSGTRWLVANSRRTPPEVGRERIAALATKTTTPVALFIDARIPGAPSLRQILESAAMAIVTDRVVVDGVRGGRGGSAGDRTCPRDQRLSPREQTYRAELQSHGWYRSLPIATDAEALLVAAASLTPRTEDPAASIADLLRRHVPE